MPIVRMTISSNSPSWYFFMSIIYSKCIKINAKKIEWLHARFLFVDGDLDVRKVCFRVQPDPKGNSSFGIGTQLQVVDDKIGLDTEAYFSDIKITIDK